MKKSILIVDDETDICTLISGILEDDGYHTCIATTPDQALELLSQNCPHLVLLDVWLNHPTLDGLDLLKMIKSSHPNMPVMMMSGHGNLEMAVRSLKQGSYDFIEKPFQMDRLLLAVQHALENARLLEENSLLKSRFTDENFLKGNSTAIRHLHTMIQQIAPTNSRILILGESGTGKEQVAWAIHNQSPRAPQPFVLVNCATLHPDKLEELMGGPQGFLAQSLNGTLVLDNITDMPLISQGKIARILQDQTFSHSEDSILVQARILSITHIDIRPLMNQGLFREDLYYRLSVIPITVPPLRSRKKDINELVELMMRHAGQVFRKEYRSFTFEALAAFQRYHWPGNVRELKNLIERIIMLCPDDQQSIGLDFLPPEISGLALPLVDDQDILNIPLKRARELFESQYLLAQISRFGGNISQTAHFIGMERTALHRKLRHLGVSMTAIENYPDTPPERRTS